MQQHPTSLAFLAGLALAASAPTQSDAHREPVQVVVLAGQSNMEGKAQDVLWDRQATAPDTAAFFAHLRDGDGWAVRDDVFITFLDRHGPLTLGYGSPNRTGVELELGTVLGEHIDAPVLLIKTAWGGHSLRRDFRPPSSGLPSEAALAAELDKAVEQATRRNEQRGRADPLPTIDAIRDAYGRSYRNMLAEVRRVCDHADTLFPALADRELRMAGFVWFQGWNDQYDGAETEYADHMANFIRDVRRDLRAPDLPFVIGVMGQNGSEEAKGAMLAIQQAQLAMPRLDEFRDTVRAVRTDVLVDTAAEQLYPTWQQNREQWDRTGSDHKYHYLGSAIWFTRMGRAFAEALLELRAR